MISFEIYVLCYVMVLNSSRISNQSFTFNSFKYLRIQEKWSKVLLLIEIFIGNCFKIREGLKINFPKTLP